MKVSGVLFSLKFIFILLLGSILYSCIPYSFAPNIKGNDLVKAKRFKRDLPDLNALVFKDPKAENAFHDFIRMQFKDFEGDQLLNIPFSVSGKTYYLSCYERERATKTFNLLPVIVDGVLDSPVLEDNYTSRFGTWYIVLTVTDDAGTDCLSEKYKDRLPVVTYLRLLHSEYLEPMNTLEALDR